MLLRAEGLQKAYQGRPVVRSVSMQLETGEVAGLLGPNGAGKTTCFYMLVGLIPPDAGRIWLDQENISHEPIHRRARKGLSYLPQEASVFRRLSVADNIRAVLELQTDTAGNRLSKAEIAAQLERLLGERRTARTVSLRRGATPSRDRAGPRKQPSIYFAR
jgi:lipopolysaccharide export system ATP-binding protein